MVSGDQRSSVIAIRLARPMTGEPVVQAQANGDVSVRLGASTAVAARTPAAAPLPQAAKPSVSAKAIVLGPVASVEAPAAAAAPAKTLALMEALAMAELKDPKLAAARSELAAKLETKSQALAGYMPNRLIQHKAGMHTRHDNAHPACAKTKIEPPPRELRSTRSISSKQFSIHSTFQTFRRQTCHL